MNYEDFQLLPKVLESYDMLKKGNVNEKGLESLIFTKLFEDGTTYVVEEVRNGKKELALSTRYKRKNPGGLMPTIESIPPLTSETTPENTNLGNNNGINFTIFLAHYKTVK